MDSIALRLAKGSITCALLIANWGFINFTPIPNTQVDESALTISLVIDFDEGKRFYVSSALSVSTTMS